MKRPIARMTALALILALLTPLLVQAESDSSWLNRQRKAIGRQLVEVQAGNWIEAMPYYAQDIEYHDPVVTIEGKETMAEFLARMFTSSANLITTIHDETCINGMYSATWTMVGDFNGVPYSAEGMSVLKFRGRELQVFYQRDYYTEGDIMAQIPGLDEAIAGFRVYYRCAVDPTFDCPLQKSGNGAPGEDMTLLDDPALPSAFRLGQNVPNPFNPSTTISFDVPAGGVHMTLRIYDVSGKLVRTLVDGYEPSGNRTVVWNGTDDMGRPLASGIYYYQLNAADFSAEKRMVLLK